MNTTQPNRPKVTVAIPTYNAARYLPETIEAVRNQSFTDWQLVIVDNASTDETASILDRLIASTHDSRIQITRNQSTVPAPENWNIAVSLARGTYIKLVCADDVATPDCLERQVRALDDNPTAVLASSSRTIVDSRGRKLFVRNGIGRSGLYPGRAMIRRCIMAGTNIIGEPVNAMWRRTAMEEVGVFDPAVVYCTDVEYWLRLLGVGDLYFDAVPVGSYRIHHQAAATGFASVTVEDFTRTARKQVDRGTVTLTRFDMGIIRAKSWLQSHARQAIYRWLA